jgi:hypothetical protein
MFRPVHRPVHGGLAFLADLFSDNDLGNRRPLA